MYKDPDKQREANAERQRRYRAERGRQAYPKGVTDSGRDKAKGVTNTGCDGQGVTDERSNVIPKILKRKTLAEIVNKECEGMATKLKETLDNIIPKRGKDIKCFADLPPHVQETIDMMSMVDGKIDKTVKANRTAIAVNYQHLFPDRFHSTGVI